MHVKIKWSKDLIFVLSHPLLAWDKIFQYCTCPARGVTYNFHSSCKHIHFSFKSVCNKEHKGIICIIIPHVNSPYKTSIDERLIFYNITRCYSDGEYCHSFAIAVGNIIKYQGGHMMGNADARTVHSRQETFNSNGGHEA